MQINLNFAKSFGLSLAIKVDIFNLDIRTTPWIEPSKVLTDADYDKNVPQLLFEDYKAGFKRRLKYIIPITNPLGPKQTPCYVNESIHRVSAKYIQTNSVKYV
jgi:hypothetical protein